MGGEAGCPSPSTENRYGVRATERTVHAALTYDGEVSQLPYLLALPLQSPSTKGLEL